jgi:hypothetical protein
VRRMFMAKPAKLADLGLILVLLFIFSRGIIAVFANRAF